MTGQTLFDKIWAQHVVTELPGGVSLIHVDRNLLHDLEAGPSLGRLTARGLCVHDPDLTFATPDHAISSAARSWPALGAARCSRMSRSMYVSYTCSTVAEYKVRTP